MDQVVQALHHENYIDLLEDGEDSEDELTLNELTENELVDCQDELDGSIPIDALFYTSFVDLGDISIMPLSTSENIVNELPTNVSVTGKRASKRKASDDLAIDQTPKRVKWARELFKLELARKANVQPTPEVFEVESDNEEEVEIVHSRYVAVVETISDDSNGDDFPWTRVGLLEEDYYNSGLNEPI